MPADGPTRLELLHLEVEHFGCIAAAELELGPGLNLLYGPNDLGKSSLAAAIRAALLLPHASSACQSWVEWQSDQTPRVVLSFRTSGDEVWRVEKQLGPGSRGAALLACSSGGEEAFNVVAKGRQVDGELRRLLAWGIPGPGGRGAPRGEPSSFLTAALLAHQDRVAEVLGRNLAEDSDSTGRQRLGEALQALVQDPLSRTVLQCAGSRVEEAYTATGKPKRGRTAPLERARLEVERAGQELQQLEEQVRTSERTWQRLVELRRLREERTEELEQQQARLAALETAWAADRQRRQVEERLEQAQQELRRREAVVAAVRDGEAEESAAASRLDECTRQAEHTAAEVRAAEQELEQAREQLQRLQSGSAAQQRLVRQQALENRRLELRGAIREAEHEAERAAALGRRLAVVTRLEQELARLTAESASIRTAADQAETGIAEAEAALAQLAMVERWRQHREVIGLLEQGQAACREVEALQRQAAELLQAEVSGRILPPRAALAGLRDLREALRVAEARLQVGLSVSLHPQRMLELRVSTDQGERQELGLVAGEESFEAQQQLDLELVGQAELRIRGGSRQDREQAELLRQRWQDEAEPVLAAAGAGSLEEVEAAVQAADESAARAAELLEQAARIEERVTAGEGLHAWIEGRQGRLTDLEQELTDTNRDALQAQSEQLGDHLGQRSQEVRDSLDEHRRGRQQLELELTRIETRRESTEAELATARQECGRSHEEPQSSEETELAPKQALRVDEMREDLDALVLTESGGAPEGASSISGSVQSTRDCASRRQDTLVLGLAQAAAGARIEALGQELEQVGRQLTALAEEAGTEISEAEERCEAAADRLTTARAGQQGAMAGVEAAQASLATSRGRLQERRQAADAVDPEEARLALQAVQAELAALPEPSEPLSETELARVRRDLSEAEAGLREVEAQLNLTTGELRQVGGDVARERCDRAEEALDQARRTAEELELEYRGWQLLQTTLQEVEAERSEHLGRSLLPPISESFQELTRGRYGRLVLGPNLETDGIEAGGGTREVGALSVGTRDQLATLFRLAVARQLRSVLLLDDQLTQSDADRLGWFAKLLRQEARQLQIVVLTCRPGDYLLPDELAGPEHPVAESPDRLLRAIDLERVIERADDAWF